MWIIVQSGNSRTGLGCQKPGEKKESEAGSDHYEWLVELAGIEPATS